MFNLLLITYIALQLLDFWTTHTIIKKGGYERNPLILWLMQRIGNTKALVVYKIIGILAGILVYSTGYLWAMALITGFMFIVIVNNIIVLNRL